MYGFRPCLDYVKLLCLPVEYPFDIHRLSVVLLDLQRVFCEFLYLVICYTEFFSVTFRYFLLHVFCIVALFVIRVSDKFDLFLSQVFLDYTHVFLENRELVRVNFSKHNVFSESVTSVDCDNVVES